jgi:hypothetical protein
MPNRVKPTAWPLRCRGGTQPSRGLVFPVANDQWPRDITAPIVAPANSQSARDITVGLALIIGFPVSFPEIPRGRLVVP